MREIQAVATLRSLSPYSQSKHHTTPKKEGESSGDWESRTWRERLHVENGEVVIPPMCFKNCLDLSGPFLGKRIVGEGKKTWTKVLESGVMVTEPLRLGIKPDEVDGEWLFVNADGKRGSGTRVDRCYPRINEWEGDVAFHILNPKITEDIFREHLECAGKFIGIGRFRPQNRGFYGRFAVEELEWIET